MAEFLPYGRQTIEDDDVAAVAEAQDELLVTPVRVPHHQMPEQRLTPQERHGLGRICYSPRQVMLPLDHGPHPETETSAEQDDSHAAYLSGSLHVGPAVAPH